MPYDLRLIQTEVDDWIKKYGVRYFNELTNMALLTEEVGELARIMARKYGEQSFKPGDRDKGDVKPGDRDKGDVKPGDRDKGDGGIGLEEEIADVLFVLVCIANQTGVDLDQAFRASMEKKTMRDKDRHKGNEKLR